MSANSVESVAFWKQPIYKYSAPEETSSTPAQETISTVKFEKYFPSNVRNFAPMINMKLPMGDWDPSCYLEVGSEFVSLSVDLAQKVSVSTGLDSPSIASSAIAEKYFGEGMYVAPDIVIRRAQTPRVDIEMKEVPEPLAEAEAMLGGGSKASEPIEATEPVLAGTDASDETED